MALDNEVNVPAMLGNVIMFELTEVNEPSVKLRGELCNTFDIDAIVKAKYGEVLSWLSKLATPLFELAITLDR